MFFSLSLSFFHLMLSQDTSRAMISHYSPSHHDHDLTELSWLTRSNIFDRTSASVRRRPVASHSFPTYSSKSVHSPPSSLVDSSDSEHDIDSSSLNSSSERVMHTSADLVSPPHSALCFWILFAIEESATHALTLNDICDWIEHHIEQQPDFQNAHPVLSDEQYIHSTRLKSKVRYHMTKQISFFVKIVHDPIHGIKLRYPLWAADRSKRSLLLDTLLTMNARQLSLYTQYTIDVYDRLCNERRRALLRPSFDERTSPNALLNEDVKRDKTIHRLGSADESSTALPPMHNKRKKQRSKMDFSGTAEPSVEVVDAALTLLLLRQPRWDWCTSNSESCFVCFDWSSVCWTHTSMQKMSDVDWWVETPLSHRAEQRRVFLLPVRHRASYRHFTSMTHPRLPRQWSDFIGKRKRWNRLLIESECFSFSEKKTKQNQPKIRGPSTVKRK